MRNSKLSILCGLIALLVLAFGGISHAQLADVTQPGDPIVGTSNNSPGSEGVVNAIDDTDKKYLNFDRLNTGFTVTPRVGLTVVQCISLKSANDAPERDPATYTLQGSYDGSTFVQISSGSVPSFGPTGTNRFFKVVIQFENTTPYLTYRLIFPTVVGPGGNSMQIAEVELLGFLAPTDVTQPSDPIVGTSNNSPGSEGVVNAIDNTDKKYLNFDRLNTGFTVTPSVGGTLVSGITLKSANDAPERDPASYRLEGSLDGTSFFEIASGAVPSFGPTGTNRFYKNYIFFANSRAYRSYRLIFPTVVGPGGNSMQIAEVELLGVVSDLPQDVTQPGDPIVGTSNNSPGSEGVVNAIDDTDKKYLNFDRLNTGFTVSPRAGLTIVSGLTLKSANDAPERDPADYTLSGSYDGVNFVAISSGTVPSFGPTGTNRFFKNTVLFNNKIPYLQYRLIFPNVVGPGGNSMQIAEVELLGVLAPTDVTVPGDPIVATSNNSPGSEGVVNAIDNTDKKYLNFDRVNTGFTVTPNVGDTIVIGLTLKSANDGPERDPSSYTLDGSNDGANFVPISSGSVPSFGPTGTNRFYKNYIFFPNNTKSFKAYRLIFPTTAGNSTCCMQIAEVEFLGTTPGVVNTNPVTTLIARQPVDTPVLLGQPATFRVRLTGPWRVQWYRNGVAIPGATSDSYTTAPTVAADDGALFKAVVQGDGRQTSDEVMLNIFTPSTTESIGLSWRGGGANGAPTDMLPQDITGFHLQAYWNNLAGGSATTANPRNSLNQPHPTISVTWATSGEWGAGTGNGDPTERMLNGMVTSFSTTEAGAQTVTINGVPAGSHSVLLYAVQVPQEFFNVDFIAVTHGAGGADVIQRRYIRPLNSDEYNPSPGFSLVTADSAGARGVGNMVRFDNLQPGADGIIQIRFYSPGRVDLPGGDPIRGPGLNAMQLLLNPGNVGQPPTIVRQPASANGLAGGCITLTVEATGPNLAYQWLKNGQEISGADDPQLTLANLKAEDAANYTVVVSNPAGRVLSRTAVVGIVPSAQITAGLISYFPLNDFDGLPVIVNAAPGGVNGEFRGDPFPSIVDHIGTALYFNGGDHVFVPNYTKVSRNITVSGWVQPDVRGALVNNWVEGQPTGSSGQFFVELGDDAGVPVLRAQIEVGPNRVQASGQVDDDPFYWHHFAMTANGVTLSIYWDGVLVAVADYLGTINNTPGIPWLSIGANLMIPGPVISGGGTVGNIDDVALWNRSLSAAEIQGIYSAGLQNIGVAATPPVLTVGTCPPTIICPPNVTGECGSPVNFTATATDQAGNPVAVTCTPPSGSVFALGGTTVNCTATAGGQSSSCSFRVTVRDSTPPTITCPANLTVQCAADVPAFPTTLAEFIAAGGAASDSCDTALEFNSSETGNLTACGGTLTRTFTVTDDSTNRASCVQIITVNDTIPPVLTCPGNITASDRDPVIITPPIATDNCGPLPSTCLRSDNKLLSEPFPLGTTTVTCSVVDACQNLTSCAFTVTILPGNQAPTCVARLAPEQCGLTFPPGPGLYAIAANGQDVCLTLDGSGSSDPDGDALTFTWVIDGTNIVSGALANVCLPVGCHTITMTASDGRDRCHQFLDVCVVTPSEACEQLIQLVENTDVERKNKRPLIVSLKAAKAAFDREGTHVGAQMLVVFQYKVRAQIARNNPAEADLLTDAANDVLNALACEN